MKKIILVLLVLILLLNFASQSFPGSLDQKADNESGKIISPIHISYPNPNSTTRSNLVYGRIPEGAVKVTVNDIEAQLFNYKEDPGTGVFLARPSFKQGENTITIQAQDTSGNIINKSQLNITYNTIKPKIVITDPADNSIINTSPIESRGKYSEDLHDVMFNCGPEGGLAYAEKGNFKISPLNLESNEFGFIILEVFDLGQKFYDAILIKMPQPADYRLIADPDSSIAREQHVAGSKQILKVRLLKNWGPAVNEKILFKVTQGKGKLSQPSVLTNSHGEATVVLTTDNRSSVKNEVECYLENNPMVKDNIEIFTKDR